MHRATVVAVSGAGVWVTCPAILPGVRFGPCQHVGSAPSVGDSVLVADLGDAVSPDLVVIGVLS